MTNILLNLLITTYICYYYYSTVIEILKNNLKLTYSKYYINIKHSIETDNILHDTRQLVKFNFFF